MISILLIMYLTNLKILYYHSFVYEIRKWCNIFLSLIFEKMLPYVFVEKIILYGILNFLFFYIMKRLSIFLFNLSYNKNKINVNFIRYNL